MDFNTIGNIFKILNKEQLCKLHEALISEGFDASKFSAAENVNCLEIAYNLDLSYRLRICASIYGAHLCDIFCEPYTLMDHIYCGCDKFSQVVEMAKNWAKVFRYILKGLPYIHKIFISHSTDDQNIVTNFVDRILLNSCGLTPQQIAYTSLQSTGVELGESIPEFIKHNIKEATYVLLMVSDNFKKSEVCLNEMGAAWAMDKKLISILLPNVSFKKLGWLTSLEKAIKIEDARALDRLYSLFNTKGTDSIEWNRHRDNFLSSIKS